LAQGTAVGAGNGLFFAIVITYLVWPAEFGYARYMALLDVLSGAAVLFLAMQISWPVLRFGVVAVISIVSWTVLVVADWSHLPWEPHWQTFNPTPLDFDGPAIVEKPTLYVAASLQTNARYVGIYGDIDLRADTSAPLTQKLKLQLDTPSVQLKEVDVGSVPVDVSAILASYGLRVTTTCHALQMPIESFRICDVEHEP
jgi:hypothetical protein